MRRSRISSPDTGGDGTIVGRDLLRVFSVVAHSPAGDEIRVRVTVDTYRRIVAATNFKQRVRKTLEYYHADRLDYAVAGTPNRLEYDLGFSSRTATVLRT